MGTVHQARPGRAQEDQSAIPACAGMTGLRPVHPPRIAPREWEAGALSRLAPRPPRLAKRAAREQEDRATWRHQGEAHKEMRAHEGSYALFTAR